MGTDIHVCIQVCEVDEEKNGGDGWHEIPYHRSLYDHEIEQGITYPKGVAIAPHALTNRNYDTFAILANVRNGFGFGGIKTGEGLLPIAAGRGWPAGFCEETPVPDPRYINDRDGDPSNKAPRYMGYHDFTWVSLDELKAYPWDKNATVLYGVVPAQEYERMRAFGKLGQCPQSWSGDVSGPGITTYEAEEWEKIRATKLPLPPLKNPDSPFPGGATDYVRMSWRETAKEATGEWPTKVIPWLEGLAAGRPLRLVLGFDS